MGTTKQEWVNEMMETEDQVLDEMREEFRKRLERRLQARLEAKERGMVEVSRLKKKDRSDCI
jgi:aspartate/tyrosine/aromatic aminotransferase